MSPVDVDQAFTVAVDSQDRVIASGAILATLVQGDMLGSLFITAPAPSAAFARAR
jgi:hypothetical protein